MPSASPPRAPPPFSGSQLRSWIRSEHGRWNHTLRWLGAPHQLRAVHNTDKLRALLGLLAMLAVAFGSLILGMKVQSSLGGRGSYGDAALFIIVIVGVLGGGCTMAYILPRGDVSVHAETEDGPLVLAILVDQRVSLGAVPYSVTDGDGTLIGRLFRGQGLAGYNWKCLDRDGALLWTAAELSTAKALGRTLLAGALHGGHAIADAVPARYLIADPRGAELGIFTRSAAGEGQHILDLSPDRAAELDHRLLVAMVAKA